MSVSSIFGDTEKFDSVIFDTRLGKVFRSKARANFMVSNSPEAFKKNQVMPRHDMLRKMGLGG